MDDVDLLRAIRDLHIAGDPIPSDLIEMAKSVFAWRDIDRELAKLLVTVDPGLVTYPRRMHVDVMTGGLGLREVSDLARATSEAGFDGMILTEGARTAYLSCAAVSLAAPDLEIGTGIAVAFPRSPMVTAEIAWELADVSNGKFQLGLGTQVRAHMERRYSVEFDPPGPRLREYVVAVRNIFKAFNGEEKLAVEGKFYNLSLLGGNWNPGPIEHPDVPILISAVGPWMCRMAGEVADGIHVHPMHSSKYITDTVQAKVAEGAARVGRDPSEVDLVIPVLTIVGDTEEERAKARQRARNQIAFYGSTKNYGFMFDQLGFDGTSARLNEKMKAGDMEAMAAIVDDDILPHFSVEASWDDMSNALVDRYSAAAERIVIYFAASNFMRDPSELGRWGEVARDVQTRTA